MSIDSSRFFSAASRVRHQLQQENEINIAKQLRHSLNVARLHEVLEDDRCLYLITELCTGGELGHRIKKGRYSERDAAHIIRDILQLLAQSHVQNVILRDVKPENLLFLNESEGSPLKAIDFGIARRCASNQYLSERCGSPVYVAPEVLQKRYSLPADVWSAGIIAYMLLTGRLPWKGEAGISVSQLYDGGEGGAFSRRDAFKALMFDELDFESHPWELISAGGRDLVQRMLQKDPAQRITAKAALKHRWLQSEGQGAAPDRPFEDTIVQRLQQFGMYGKVKQAALKQLVASLPSDSEVVQQFRDVFESGEQASQGSVSYNSLLQVLLGKGFCLTETEGHHLISLLDADGGGSVDEHEWMAATLDWQKVQESDEWSQWVERLLQAVASDASGCMEITDLKQVLLSAQCPRESDSEEDTSLQELAGTDQRVSVEDFKSMLVNDSSEDDLTMFDSRLDKRSTHNSNGS
ncbi:hypothetical protein WJX72_008502 [[Myrmecia] bisecta]|uniref:Protein kinase domain-containing protein n=1 Tax=[Myrmecia] bisecta TaxID=41462 RepID=A0AAW1PSW5_9CHLO